MNDRYGPPPGRWTRVGLVLLAAGAVVTVVWLGLRIGRPAVAWQDVSFRIEPERVTVTYDVIRDPALPVTCRVEAQNQRHAQVGVVRVDVPPGQGRVVRVTTVVNVSEPAVTALVDRCWTAAP